MQRAGTLDDALVFLDDHHGVLGSVLPGLHDEDVEAHHHHHHVSPSRPGSPMDVSGPPCATRHATGAGEEDGEDVLLALPQSSDQDLLGELLMARFAGKGAFEEVSGVFFAFRARRPSQQPAPRPLRATRRSRRPSRARP